MSSILRRQVFRAAAGSLSTVARPQIQAIPARLTLAARSYASASAAEAPLKSNISTTSSALVSSTKDLIISGNRIVAGAVVSRQPLILRDLSPFEKEYFTYQKSLERDNAAPFGAEFYFKKGSVAERRWKQQEAERAASSSSSASSTASKSSASKGSEAAAAEELTEEDRVAAMETKIEFNARVTEADRNNDIKSLERALQRTLYLIVKKPRDQHAWQFPQGGVRVCENLQEAAGRELQEECGGNMDLWFVGRVPIGHYMYSPPVGSMPESSANVKGIKVFFMKAHIFAGQVQVDNKEIVDFAWVTKQEMKDYVSSEYYEAVKDMLSDF
ncbi:39S mitochondrial ribosomal protein L46-domain-containing protein [Gamsiella multidivaricata]|uniref:39S mitochondrial ribosomal protein L46-domain-containing protein n=1 Tax=Gamsiella multidivaricata TaxID=101098 RepID=UPI002220AE03|nr:39S mitochondrial ribosomal protein L46-domain-containing protein [Gamsiella multidivaricata]KAG0370669.1 54S ribosomal protein L17 mitochondrial [Gamsiella multidivaricata]KAI7819600.1 39S mitochondrial ribosomal protein L46-domain-containing protein [Gamsiella multidivaricata]